MQILSETKETKETLQKRRNLFGLGLTSLIAACGADKAAGDGGGDNVDEGTPTPTITLPFEAERLSKATDSGFTTARGGGNDQFTVAITAEGEVTPKTLTFADGNNEDNLLGIYKLTATEDQAEDQFDLVIASPNIYTDGTAAAADNDDYRTGRIFIFWNIADIKDESIGKNEAPTVNSNARLEIKGARKNDQIGSKETVFLQIASDTKYDMVIRSRWVDKGSDDPDNSNITQVGAIYILWDVAKYADETKTIDLANANDDSYDFLAVYGGIEYDFLGSKAPTFFQIGGKENNYDMVIGSSAITKLGLAYNESEIHGAIYILWDIADYAGDSQVIDLGILSQATSGLLAIYGPHTNSNLGQYTENIIYGEDAAGNKTLTNIDGDTANGGTNDIAFQDTDYTYILFGDEIAEVDSTTQKVKSKAIDLAKVKDAFDADAGTDAGFFKYNFGDDPTIISDDTNATIIPIEEADTATGYRFASGTGHSSNGNTTLAAVEGAFPKPPALSDTDADLGVWDIA